MPWSMPADRPSRLLLDDGSHLTKENLEEVWFPACDQWGVHCYRFSAAVANGAPAPVPIEDAIANMRVLDAIARAARSGQWERP
jgi:predicted dehydrogenase